MNKLVKKFGDFVDVNESFLKRALDEEAKLEEDLLDAASVHPVGENEQSEDYPVVNSEPQISDETYHYGSTYTSEPKVQDNEEVKKVND